MSDADAPPYALARCRNCETFLGDPPGKFCPACGQDTLNHPPTFWEFVHEFITHYVALEGKLWKTLAMLFFKPAELTREYRQGRKQRYISPLRLYITASFLFFFVVKIAGMGSMVDFEPWDEATKAPGAVSAESVETKRDAVSASAKKLREQVKQAASTSAGSRTADEKELNDSVEKTVESAINLAKEGSRGLDSKAEVNMDCGPDSKFCQSFENHLKKKYKNKTGRETLEMLKNGAISNIPYAMFMLLPLFALLTKILYFRRGYYYGEHVVYALHIHAFTFFAMLMFALLPSWLDPFVALAAAIYYLVALQRFFGGNWFLTLIRYGIIGMVYPVLLSLVAAAVLLIVVVA